MHIQCNIFLDELWWNAEKKPTVYDLMILLNSTEEVNSNTRAQLCYQQTTQVDLVRLIKSELNNICRKVFIRDLPVRWPALSHLTCTLITGHFRL